MHLDDFDLRDEELFGSWDHFHHKIFLSGGLGEPLKLVVGSVHSTHDTEGYVVVSKVSDIDSLEGVDVSVDLEGFLESGGVLVEINSNSLCVLNVTNIVTLGLLIALDSSRRHLV